jgi:hypothetical protein
MKEKNVEMSTQNNNSDTLAPFVPISQKSSALQKSISDVNRISFFCTISVQNILNSYKYYRMACKVHSFAFENVKY